MTGLAGRAAFDRRAGLIAAGIVALYPNIWLYERELMPETLALLGVATCIWLTYRFIEGPTPSLAFGLGATVGLLALTRSEQIALMVFLVLPVILSARGVTWRRRWVWLALACLGGLLLIAPWTAYNSTRSTELWFCRRASAPALRAGNCEPAYGDELLGYYQDQVGAPCSRRAPNLSSDPSVADGQLRRAAFDFMEAHRRVPVVIAARIGRTFNVYRPFQQVHLEAERRSPLRVLRLALFSYWALVPPAIAGAVLARRQRIAIYPLLVFPVIVLLSVALTIGAVRYRAPAEVPLAILAAFAIDVVTARRQQVPEADTQMGG